MLRDGRYHSKHYNCIQMNARFVGVALQRIVSTQARPRLMLEAGALRRTARLTLSLLSGRNANGSASVSQSIGILRNIEI